MSISRTRTHWIRPALLAAAIYAVVGVVTADLAISAPSLRTRTFWRLAAWVISLVTFAGHIAYDQIRFRNAVRNTAAHAAAAVALGAFALAAAGPVRSHWGTSDFWRSSALSLPLWPILTGIPAFLVALVAGAIVRRIFMRDKAPHSV